MFYVVFFLSFPRQSKRNHTKEIRIENYNDNNKYGSMGDGEVNKRRYRKKNVQRHKKVMIGSRYILVTVFDLAFCLVFSNTLKMRSNQQQREKKEHTRGKERNSE